MTLLERRMLTLAFIFCILTCSVWTGRLAAEQLPSLWDAPAAHAFAFSGTFYGANEAWAAQAASDWPQHDPNWCGVANIEMIANYTYQLAANNGNTYPFQSGGQGRIANDLNNVSGVRILGTGPPTNKRTWGLAGNAGEGGSPSPPSSMWGADENANARHLA